MANRQKQRQKEDRVVLLTKRIPVLKEAITTYALTLPPHALVIPDIGDILPHSVVQQLLNDTSHQECIVDDFGPLLEIFSDLFSQWQGETEAKLIDIIASECGDSYSFDPKMVLQLPLCSAAIAYGCTGHGVFVQHPRILVHSHAVHGQSFAAK